jgi:hypothetical protein
MRIVTDLIERDVELRRIEMRGPLAEALDIRYSSQMSQERL